MKKLLLLSSLFPLFALASLTDKEQPLQRVAKPQQPEKTLPDLPAQTTPIQINVAELKQNFELTQTLLNQAIYSRQADKIEQLLAIYQQFEQKDPMLVSYAQGKLALLKRQYGIAIERFRHLLAQQPNLNSVRIELAIALFHDQQNSAAQDQFHKAQSAETLPEPVNRLIQTYQEALQQRNRWQFSGYAYYEKDDNINNTSDAKEIENTGYVKNSNMLPQSANGIAYGFNLARDFNLINSHYFTVENQLNGKSFWDNHDYDDITNRLSVGYRYKKSKQSLRLSPFYEKRWYGGKSNNWINGIRGEFNHWISPNWQISTAFEYGKNHYFDNEAQNGSNQLASLTLLWLRNPKQFFYTGVDFNREKTQVLQYSSDTKSIRTGWGQEWQYFGLSSRLAFTFAKRDYKATAFLGGIINLGKIRSDKVYSLNLMLWKRDWHWLGVTPKLQFTYRKQNSNLPTLYSYTDKNVNILFESQF